MLCAWSQSIWVLVRMSWSRPTISASQVRHSAYLALQSTLLALLILVVICLLSFWLHLDTEIGLFGFLYTFEWWSTECILRIRSSNSNTSHSSVLNGNFFFPDQANSESGCFRIHFRFVDFSPLHVTAGCRLHRGWLGYFLQTGRLLMYMRKSVGRRTKPWALLEVTGEPEGRTPLNAILWLLSVKKWNPVHYTGVDVGDLSSSFWLIDSKKNLWE